MAENVENFEEAMDDSMPEDDPNGNVNTQMTSQMGAGAPRWGPKHAGAQQLAAMYSKGKRIQEAICLIIGALLVMTNLGFLCARWHLARFETVALSAFLGALAADFASGFVHWAADTWGSVNTPILGKNFIRPFREHHVDPTAITRHDFIEVNGDSFMLAIPKMLVVLWQHLRLSESELRAEYPWHWFWLLVAGYVAITNQIHKWSHTYFGLPRFVEILQRLHLILPRKHHKIHHVAPHSTYYCITTGWLNAPLDVIAFWGRLEAVITYVTGSLPRSDDMKWALKLD